MDLLFQHKLRQREQSTWAWTEHPSDDMQGGKGGGTCVDGSKLSYIDSADSVPSAKWGLPTGDQQQQQIPGQEEQMLDYRRNQQCCCETLENALVTIDILRSKLVSKTDVLPTLQSSQNVQILINTRTVLRSIWNAITYCCLKKPNYCCTR